MSKGFPYKDQIEEFIYCNRFIVCIPKRNIVDFPIYFIFIKLQYTYQRHDIAYLC